MYVFWKMKFIISMIILLSLIKEEHHYLFYLKVNICDERVCSMETSGTALTPKHSSPNCVAEWGVSGFNGQANRFEHLNFRCGPRSLFACPLHPWWPIPSAFGETGQINSVWGSAICSASLRAADYDRHKCQDLIIANKLYCKTFLSCSFISHLPIKLILSKKNIAVWVFQPTINWIFQHCPNSPTNSPALAKIGNNLWIDHMHMTSQKGAPACWGSNEALPRAPSPSMQPAGQPLHAIPPGWPGPAHWLRGWAPMRSASTTRARSATSLDPQHGVIVMETWRQCIRSIQTGTIQHLNK